jgi:chitosanase
LQLLADKHFVRINQIAETRKTISYLSGTSVIRVEIVMLFENLETRSLFSAVMPAAAIAPQATASMSVSAAATSVPSGMTADQKRVAEQLTSAFENSTTTLQYAYIDNNLDDGRGYTAGRAGFCTGTGDFLSVAERYTNAKPGNALAKYLPRLREINDAFIANDYEAVDDVEGLEGIEAAWKTCANDSAFRAAQDAEVTATYYTPAMNRAKTLGLTTALAKGQMYDAIIQHGDGSDHDGLAAMISRANSRSGGSPASGVNESTWLKNFLTVRKETLLNATDPSTREAWADSIDRVNVYSTLLSQGNLGLTGTIHFTVYGDSFTIQGATTTPTTPAAKGSLSGLVYLDKNKNGKKDASEVGSANRTVFIDKDGDHFLDANEVRTKTDSTGHYKFTGLSAGTYKVTLNSTSWSFSSTPIQLPVKVVAGVETKNVLFGEFRK